MTKYYNFADEALDEDEIIKAASQVFANCNDPKYNKKVFEVLKQSAIKLSNPLIYFYLARCYHTGCGGSKNILAAQKWYWKSFEGGNADSYAYLAEIYLYGDDTIIDTGVSYNYFKKAAEAGSSRGYFGLGLFYQSRSMYKEAEEFYTKGILLGGDEYKKCADNGDAFACLNIAICIHCGYGYSDCCDYYYLEMADKLGNIDAHEILVDL